MPTMSNRLVVALGQLGWLEPGVTADWNIIPTDPSTCWFRQLLKPPVGGKCILTPRGIDQVTSLVASGWTLRSSWPRPWSASVERWLGKRMFVAHCSLLADTVRFTSLISSHVGRYGSRHPEWPQWMDGVLRHVRQQGHWLLLASGTTLAESVEQFALAADIPTAKIVWAERQRGDVWLPALLGLPTPPRDPTTATRSTLFLSLPVEPACATLERLPLQDRLSLALADQVFAMAVRAGGKLDALLKRRLEDSQFPTASVYVSLPTAPTATCESERSWLERGAVGWIATASPTSSNRTRDLQAMGHCRTEDREATGHVDQSSRPLQQLSGPLPNHWRQMSADDDSDYLVHCTRATIGPLPNESAESFRMRMWSQHAAIAWQPLETLAHICCERRVRASKSITRTDTRCVSFSAVPLVPLLQRRIFRSHLGRWDWEPYGLLIRRTVLQQWGAREVVYGDEASYRKLPEPDKAFFQPMETWAEEREWRITTDVDLHALPGDSIVLFVRTQIEAQQLSRYARWPVLWVR